MLARIREFFSRRGVLEVETPALSQAAATDPHLNSLTTHYTGPGGPATLYLHTSPEFPMKRLLAAGSGSIYQICKVFRDGEAGRRHNPEFTLLEWYRVDFDHHQLMDEVAALVTEILSPAQSLAAMEKISYRDAFRHHAGIDPFTAEASAFSACAHDHGIQLAESFAHSNLDSWRDLMLTHVIEPQLGLGRLSFLYDYPASQAALARVRPGDPPLASRFELYVEGIELANGFHELDEAAEQTARFARDNETRRATGRPPMPPDQRLLAGLAQGLPDCAGVALGLDRLVMIAAGMDAIGDVITFPLDRA
jgi:lysyl-tRNA synthetase class 2